MKRVRDRDLVDRKVRLVRDIETRAGVKYAKGQVMTVYGTWRGMFHLEDATTTPRGSIRKVHRTDFEPVEETP